MSLKKLRPSVPAEMPEDYRELMERCWAFLALAQRPSFQVLRPPRARLLQAVLQGLRHVIAAA